MSDELATWILTSLLIFAAVMIGALAYQVFMFRREIRARGWQVDTTRRRKPVEDSGGAGYPRRVK